MVRNGICLNAHPIGCAQAVKDQIKYVRGKPAIKNGPKKVLVLGCSTGYGLASRIESAFGCGADTIGVSFERPGTETKPGTPGFYNNRVFDEEAKKAGLVSETLLGDAFSDEMRAQVIDLIKSKLGGKIDLLVYSLASPVRKEPSTGILWQSCIKPVKEDYSGTIVDMMTGKMSTTVVHPANEDEMKGCVKVMGGEDWQLWIQALLKAGVIADNFNTVAYSYIGPTLSWPIYRAGTLGAAKEHLEKTAKTLTAELGAVKGHAYVSINKALVTRASAVIPAIPLYVMALYRVMKVKGTHEGCIEQMQRLFSDRLYAGKAVPTDTEGRIRMDDWEMEADVQDEVNKIMARASEANIAEIADLSGYREDFLQLHGFAIPGVDYDAPVNFS
jgi:enoyl-[acyl-carrier protein] reductase/trans-2-enoyl-CoA reductase (NAD+)